MKFKFGDRVKVNTGFYEDCVGYITDFLPHRQGTECIYKIEVAKLAHERLSETRVELPENILEPV